MICVFNDSPLLFGQIHWRVVLSTDRLNVLVGEDVQWRHISLAKSGHKQFCRYRDVSGLCAEQHRAGQQAAPPPRREMPLISSQVCWEGQDVREHPHLSAADVQTFVASGGCVLLLPTVFLG